MASSSTGTSGNAQARPSGASGTSVIGSDGITMNDGHKPVQPSATAFVRTRLSSVAGCLYQLLRELQVRGLSSPYSEESQEKSVQISQEEPIQSLRAEYRNTLRLCQSLSPRMGYPSPPSGERPLRGSSSLCRTCHCVSSFCGEGHSQLLPPKSNSRNLEIFDAQTLRGSHQVRLLLR